MDSSTFEAMKLSRIIAFRRECRAQLNPATDAEVIELERRLDAVRESMVEHEPFPSNVWMGG